MHHDLPNCSLRGEQPGNLPETKKLTIFRKVKEQSLYFEKHGERSMDLQIRIANFS